MKLDLDKIHSIKSSSCDFSLLEISVTPEIHPITKEPNKHPGKITEAIIGSYADHIQTKQIHLKNEKYSASSKSTTRRKKS